MNLNKVNKELPGNANLSHYRIVSKIGGGGMGEVYWAHDARLDREVAIKVLPADFAADKDRLQRFAQEAKATSALNHPDILTVYDIGEYEGSPFIVAELLEGEELRQRLDEGPIPLRKVTEYAQQIVSGLSAAHARVTAFIFCSRLSRPAIVRTVGSSGREKKRRQVAALHK